MKTERFDIHQHITVATSICRLGDKFLYARRHAAIAAGSVFQLLQSIPRGRTSNPCTGRWPVTLAIARSGGMKERAALSVQLLAGSLQRRRAVIGSHRHDFHLMGDWSKESADIVWSIPPYMRKRSNKRRANMNHDVVLIDWAARAARRLDILAGEQGYYFPARTLGGQRTKNPYSDPGFINHALQYMPGVDMSCHSWRRGFASHGQRELGFSLNDIKLVLDHTEGAPAGDVTAGHYALDPMIAKKRTIMKKWIAWLELQVKAAIAADPSLLDREAVGEAIFRARYGAERWKTA